MTRPFWTQRQDIGPSPRTQSVMTYDAGRKRVVLFGGDGGPMGSLADTWEWDGELWTQVADTGPSGRHGHGIAYDAERKRTVLFGGNAVTGSLYRDTWEWDGEEWTQVADTGPAARTIHSLSFDSARKEVVLYGGATGPTVFGDTWAWDGTEWTQKQDVGPQPRFGHATADDRERGRLVLFGGCRIDLQQVQHAPDNPFGHSYTTTEVKYTPLGDTWEWDGVKWVAVADTGPAPRWAHGMAYDGRTVLVFGGQRSAAENGGDTWVWDGRHWTQVQDLGPSPRAGMGFAADEGRRRIVLFGGRPVGAAGMLGDTWEWFERLPAG